MNNNSFSFDYSNQSGSDNNLSLSSSTTGPAGDTPNDIFTVIFLAVVGRILLAVVSIGLIGNVALFFSVRYLVHQSQMAKSGGSLLMLESFFDGLMCFLCILFIEVLDPAMPVPQPSPDVDPTLTMIAAYALCYLWYSEVAYWIAETLSVCNLVVLTVDRYLAVVMPMKHRSFVTNQSRILLVIFIIDIIYAGVTIFECDLYVSYLGSEGVAAANSSSSPEDHYSPYLVEYTCGVTFPWRWLYFQYYIANWAFLYYLLPVVIMVFCYTSMILTLTRSNKHLGTDETNNKNNVKSKAAKQLVKTVIVLGVMFILSLAQDDITCTLSGIGVYSYVVNTPVQQIGVLTIALNYAFSPYTVFIFMPSSRNPIKKLLAKFTRKT